MLGLAILLTIGFALPWSLLLFPSADIDGWGDNATEAAYTGLALLNVALHAALMYWLYRRALRRHDAAVAAAP